jgi:hypothetical protein
VGPVTLLLVVGAAHAAPTWTLDLGSQPLAAARRPVAQAGLGRCQGESEGAVLGTAIVIYGRKAGLSAWGHASVRFLACEGGSLVDEEVEIYRFSGRTQAKLPERHPSAAFTTDPGTLRRNRGRLYLRIVPDPVDDAQYARELSRNREIHELWLPLEADGAAALRDDFHARAAAQLAAFERGEPIPEGRYVGMGRNCTVPVRNALAALGGDLGGEAPGVYPLRILRELEQHPGVERVLHPSAHALRLAIDAAGGQDAFIAQLPGEMVRPQTIIRRPLAPGDRYWAEHLAGRIGQPQAPALRPPPASRPAPNRR